MTKYRVYWRGTEETWVLSSGGTPIRTNSTKGPLVKEGARLAGRGDTFEVETKRGTTARLTENPQ